SAEGALRSARTESGARRRARPGGSAPGHGRDDRHHRDGRGAAGSGAAGHQPVARQVLLRLALDAPGHSPHHAVHRRRMSAAPGRRTYLDVLRGVAVLVMIEAHVIDSWTRAAERQTHAFRQSLVLGGFGAPLFLFLAGVAVAMSAGSKARRTGDAR